jgi:hypothetical protein
MFLHHIHDLFNRSIRAHRDWITRYDIRKFAAVGGRVFIRQPARPYKKFKPPRSQTLRSRFDAPEEITFRDHTHEVTVFVDYWQTTDPFLEHDLGSLHDCRI